MNNRDGNISPNVYLYLDIPVINISSSSLVFIFNMLPIRSGIKLSIMRLRNEFERFYNFFFFILSGDTSSELIIIILIKMYKVKNYAVAINLIIYRILVFFELKNN